MAYKLKMGFLPIKNNIKNSIIMVKEINNRLYIDTGFSDKDDVRRLRENLISLMMDITAENVDTDKLFNLVWIIQHMNEE